MFLIFAKNPYNRKGFVYVLALYYVQIYRLYFKNNLFVSSKIKIVCDFIVKVMCRKKCFCKGSSVGVLRGYIKKGEPNLIQIRLSL